MTKRILLIENDPGIRDLYMELLTSEGFQVEAVETGKEAIAALKKDVNPCLVITDLTMTDMLAMDFVSILRQQDTLISLPVVITTGHNTDSTPDNRTMQLRKPIEVDGMIKRVIELCGSGRD